MSSGASEPTLRHSAARLRVFTFFLKPLSLGSEACEPVSRPCRGHCALVARVCFTAGLWLLTEEGAAQHPQLHRGQRWARTGRDRMGRGRLPSLTSWIGRAGVCGASWGHSGEGLRSLGAGMGAQQPSLPNPPDSAESCITCQRLATPLIRQLHPSPVSRCGPASPSRHPHLPARPPGSEPG